MRTHRAFSALQPWVDPMLLRELVAPERLTAIRLEPVMRAREPAALLDLHFSDGPRHVTVPLVLLDVAMLLVREADPLVFPHAIAQLVGDEPLAGLNDAIAPLLAPLAYRGGRWNEQVVSFRDDPLFALARERGWFGAAPLVRSLPRIAPAAYARRFADPRAAVMTFGADAAELAAFLRGTARRLEASSGDVDADRYFGASPQASGETYDLLVGRGEPPTEARTIVRCGIEGTHTVPVVEPLPTDVMVSFDAADGRIVDRFSVEGAAVAGMREPRSAVVPPLGGSGGRIALVLRRDAATVPDADVDEARALAAGLAAEGFDVTIATRLADVDAFAPDLVHLFGVRDGDHAAAVAAWAAEHGVPLAVHAYHEDPAGGGYWGAMVTRYCFAYSPDDRSVVRYLGMLAARAVEVDGIGARQRYAAPAAALEQAEAVLREAAVVFVQSERERETLAALRRARPTVVVPPIPPAYDEPRPAWAWTGGERFVLVHGPVESAGNQLLVARAAAQLGVPIVIAGPVAEPAYAELVREFAADGVRLIPEPSPGELAWLYRSAAVVADVAWIGRGHARIAEAARCGGAAVVARSRWIDLPIPERWQADPADVESVARAIGEAWDAVSRRDPALGETAEAAAAGGARAIRAVVGGYSSVATSG